MSRVYILLVNWNGWKDTVECLESVFRIDFPEYRVLVCDNGSTDGSVERIKAWAGGTLDLDIPESNPLRRLSRPPVPKPVSVVEYDRDRAEAGGDRSDDSIRLVLVRTGDNLGFAGGNNVGLRYALARDDFEYVWLLNNDTVVEPDALAHLVRRMEEDPRVGICGSTLPFYDRPSLLWARGGGVFSRWIPYSRCVDLGKPVSGRVRREEVERRMGYVAGASMLVSRPFLKDVGLLCEEYFLYYEEPDWAARARGRYTLGYAPESVVYHKAGASTALLGGTPGGSRRLKGYARRNALLYARKHCPLALPTIWTGLALQRAIAFLRDLPRDGRA